MSYLVTAFFLGGWLSFPFLWFIPGWFLLSFKVCFVVFFFILIRGTLPRYRYDQLMDIGWKVLLPISLAYFFFLIIYYFIFFNVFLI